MKSKLVVLLAAACVLSACGGSDGDDTTVSAPPVTGPTAPPVGRVPGSISDSVESFIGYLLALTGVSNGDSEPLDLASVNPPVTEVAEPLTLP